MTRKLSLAVAAGMMLIGSAASAETLRIGLADDPDVLDPDQSRTFVGRIVYTALCDKLVDIDPDLNFVPQLATAWEWSDGGKTLTMKLRDGVTFHDGEKFDAAAVKANIERSKTLPESRRKSEVKSIDTVDVVDPLTVRFNLKAPDATLLATLSDRAGMMVSPKAAAEAGAGLGAKLVCSGPFKFVERVQQDRIVLEKFPAHWNAANIHFDQVIYRTIPDSTVRLANLQAGDLDMLERLSPPDIATVKADSKLQVVDVVGLGYQGITINNNNGERSKTPLGQDPRVRKALELSIDRAALNQVVFDGAHLPGNQFVSPQSQFYNQAIPVPARDVAKAKALLKEAGAEGFSFEMQFPNNPDMTRAAQVIQAMAAEAGFDVKLRATEFATMLKEQSAGNYQATEVGWSGRVDPDGNIHAFATCKGGINDTKYCNPEVDKLLDAARQTNDVAERKKLYASAIEILDRERPIIYLYHPKWIWALSSKLQGYKPYPDAMIRLEGMKKAS
ncbi:peptide ABC transporter substrate-binding protein [Thalassobaculum fulvum]|uniref:Peptide ABC transporter substrate-binding protein n=1 Tax=Thalassobaculum fulvum TaxID=1633335 RepID=A0A918XSB0_9PROT|nr:ABC transporter substrate-binding protein [Thalassobaculum fulvum]GHD51953.1 peptide ABC transporter substrate-binding protein [Thalassobaculum fulvum]